MKKKKKKKKKNWHIFRFPHTKTGAFATPSPHVVPPEKTLNQTPFRSRNTDSSRGQRCRLGHAAEMQSQPETDILGPSAKNAPRLVPGDPGPFWPPLSPQGTSPDTTDPPELTLGVAYPAADTAVFFFFFWVFRPCTTILAHHPACERAQYSTHSYSHATPALTFNPFCLPPTAGHREP